MQPKLLLFDEPLSNLDAKLREQMRVEIRDLQQRLGITSVYVTHDQIEAMAMSDVVVVMNAGRVEQVGSPREIYARPVSRFVADFIGDANFLPGVLLDTRTVRIAGTTLTLADNASSAQRHVVVGRARRHELAPPARRAHPPGPWHRTAVVLGQSP